MRADSVWSIIVIPVKIALLAALVVLGIVFVPDGFMDRVEQGVDSAAGFFRGEAQKNMPGVIQDASQQTEETKNDIGNLYQQIKVKYYPAAADWLSRMMAKF